MMHRNICITAADGQTGYLIAELLLSDSTFSSKIDSVTGLSLHSSSPKCKELTKLGAKIVPHKPGRVREMVKTLKETGCDTICLIPPAHAEKKDISVELISAASKANVSNVCLISSAGCDYADAHKQPRLREFIELESLALAAKGDTTTNLGHSPCVIRAGFYAENLLLYAPQAQSEGILPLPIGKNHKFAPVALGDVAQVAAHVLTGKGEHGFDEKHRGQMMLVTGPVLCSGEDLANAASEALGIKMQFEDISKSEAKKVLRAQSEIDNAEQDYLLDYYSLVKEGKTNYVATTAFREVTGTQPTDVSEFFKMYQTEFKPAKRVKRSH